MEKVLPQTLKFKVAFYLAVALSLTFTAFTLLVVRHQDEAMLEEAVDHVTQLSSAIIRSTRFAMMQNQPYFVHRIITDIGSDKNIDRIRIFGKEGVVIDSTHSAEIGLKVDSKAEGCLSCHRTDPPESVPVGRRWRIFEKPDGRRMLATMEVIRNESSCSEAGCHFHKPTQSVLGVIDIVYSLDAIDRKVTAGTISIAALSIAFVILAAVAIVFFVRRLVYKPLRDLETGAKRISSGNLDERIPVRSGDEFGALADSFNTMTAALKMTQDELRQAAQTLEHKVEERTRQLRAAEAEAGQHEKLAAVGLLAAGIAHELNNPLTGVLTFSHLMRQKLPEGSQDAEDMDLVIRETKRCASIIRRLLDFARQKAPEKKYADLNKLAVETARFIERPAHLQDTAVTMDLDPHLPPIWIDEDQVKQVIMNLLVNAQHATERGGSITVRTRRSPAPVSPEPGVPAVPMVELAVIDTGCGIAEKDLQRIFEPFFTSKEVGKGTGLGLSVSHGIARAHGGAIRVKSTLGKGSEFTVYLPLEPVAQHAEPETAGARE
jgi:two-component system, NtrC family, sensor kinase